MNSRRIQLDTLLPEQIVRVQEEERRHIARELHDEIGQVLTAAILNLEFHGDQPVPPDARAEVVGDLRRVLARVRDLSLNLSPPLIDEAGLEPALRWYAERQSSAGRLPVTVRVVGCQRASREVEITAFRIVQEAVTNALRHADASAIEIVVECDGELMIDVRDDGRGFDVTRTLEASRKGASLGLAGLCERATLVGGRCDIRSGADGTSIRARLPLPD